MDFKLSYNWLKEFVDVRLSPEELADRLSLHSVSVERLRRMGEGLDPKVVVGRVEKIEPHPNADKLRIVQVAIGRESRRAQQPSGSKALKLSSRLCRVVCGGTNLRDGMLVAFAPPGTMVHWHGQGDSVELKPTEIRGVRSDGMICAASEIGLGEYFSEAEREILDLEAASTIVGQPLSQALGLDDVILDCEITTNRPDLISVVGLAREVAAITGARVRAPSHESTVVRCEHRSQSSYLMPHASRLRVLIEDRSACPRYGAIIIDGVSVAPSPWWVQRRLFAAGLRPINNVVDVTNYVLLEQGQPLHAFDADRLQAAGQQSSRAAELDISVRRAKADESLRALDGNTYQLRTDDLVIAARPSEASGEGGDAERPVAIAGVIGGEETGVTNGTTRVVLECANFDPLSVRRTSRALGIRTESSIRFEKGLPLESVDHTIARVVELLCELAGGTADRPVIVGAAPPRLPAIRLEPKRVAARIGTPITPAVIQRTLTALDCRVQKKTPSVFSVTPPWWRRGDLEGAHDLVEEVARVYGYHRLPSVLPTGTLPAAVQPPQPSQTSFDWEDRARSILTGAGATEILTYSLTGRATIERCGYTTDQAIALENPLSEELAYLRPSLIPTLLPLIAENQGHTASGLLFELGNVYIPKPQAASSQPQADRSAGLPREELRLCVAAYGRMVSGGHVMQVKGIVEHLLARLGIRDAEFRPSEQCELSVVNANSQRTPYALRLTPTCLWHPGRTMDVVVGGTLVGVLGEIHPTVVEQSGVDQRVAAAELDWAPILERCGSGAAPAPPSTFPTVKRDLAFVVDRRTPYADITAVLERFDPLLASHELFDQYEGGNLSLGKKSLAFHLVFEHPDRTLTAAEVDALLARLTAALQQRFGAEVRE